MAKGHSPYRLLGESGVGLATAWVETPLRSRQAEGADKDRVEDAVIRYCDNRQCCRIAGQTTQTERDPVADYLLETASWGGGGGLGWKTKTEPTCNGLRSLALGEEGG
jgi:hypothetical protein